MEVWIAETLGDGAIAVRMVMADEEAVWRIAEINPHNILFFAELTTTGV